MAGETRRLEAAEISVGRLLTSGDLELSFRSNRQTRQRSQHSNRHLAQDLPIPRLRHSRHLRSNPSNTEGRDRLDGQSASQLTWYNKDKALIPTETGKYGYTWVDPSDPRYCETHTLVLDDYVQGTQNTEV